MAKYAADGSWLMDVSGAVGTGLYTVDGKIRGIIGPGKGLYHSSGAYRVSLNTPGSGVYDDTGALRVANFPDRGIYSNTGAIRVTTT